MSSNRGADLMAVLLVTALLGAGCGKADPGAPVEPDRGAPTSVSTAVTTTPDVTEPIPESGDGAAARPGDTGETTTPSGAVADDSGDAGATPEVPDLAAKRWGGADYDPGLAARMPADPLYPGDRTEVLGESAVICAAGGFYGVHYIAAPEPGGCGSAEAVMAAAFENEDAVDNVHFTQPRAVDVGDGRAVRCVEKGNILFDCRDPEGGPVAWFW
ncbi:hypothetical protein M0E84_01085 [Corynebacterium sp. CCM 9186]|uniref:hypothetical protein n=1 Tax=Corynebacterium meridianum TaxID=2765363 RepID=UPI0020069A45|nr:hypothetical protein [Corynebacterium meridianum]MCK7676642.1 hypothetical protein [Corynebacterium meridianum]